MGPRVDAPLAGVGVVVTRPGEDGDALGEALVSHGASVLHWPTVRWAAPADPRALNAALERVADFDWIVLTSPRAAAAISGAGQTRSGRVRVAAVGRSTAAAAEAAGWRVDLVPSRQTAEALVEALRAAGVGNGTRVLFPASEIARETLEAGLDGLGADVLRVTAYRTLPAELDRPACERALESGQVQVVSLTSPSALENLMTALGDRLFGRVASRLVFAAIGPTTATAARAAGAMHVIEAPDHSLEGLADRIAEWGANQREEHNDLSDQ